MGTPNASHLERPVWLPQPAEPWAWVRARRLSPQQLEVPAEGLLRGSLLLRPQLRPPLLQGPAAFPLFLLALLLLGVCGRVVALGL